MRNILEWMGNLLAGKINRAILGILERVADLLERYFDQLIEYSADRIFQWLSNLIKRVCPEFA